MLYLCYSTLVFLKFSSLALVTLSDPPFTLLSPPSSLPPSLLPQQGGNIYEEVLTFSLNEGTGLLLRNDKQETAGNVSLTLRVKVFNPQLVNAEGVASSDPEQNGGTINPTLAPLPLGLGLMYLPSALPDAVAALTAVRCVCLPLPSP